VKKVEEGLLANSFKKTLFTKKSNSFAMGFSFACHAETES